MRVAVIGAGVAGLTAAYELSKAGVQVHVFEASNALGGLSRTIDLWNQRVDLGPHRFFSSDRRVNRLWLEVVGEDYEMVRRLTRIYYRGRYFHYPLKPVNALRNLGIFEACRCVSSFFRQRLVRSCDTESFEGWVTERFGRRLFEIFFKAYSEKLWGISCRELDSDFAAQRIKKLSLFSAVLNALFQGRGNRHKTLVDEFAYPTLGSGLVYTRMADYVSKNEGEVYLNAPVKRVVTRNGEAVGVELMDGRVLDYDRVISTMPLTQMVSRLEGAPEEVRQAASCLKFRNTILVYLKLDRDDLFPDNWLYIHSDDLEVGRITNFRNWTEGLYGEDPGTILAMEYWCNSDDARWSSSDAELIELASAEFCKTGLNDGAPIANGFVHRIDRSYPVYERGYKQHLAVIEEHLRSIGRLSVIGRYGAFKYNNQDHSILMGLMAAENLIDGERNNLWAVNTDYESYQESAVITNTGLSEAP